MGKLLRINLSKKELKFEALPDQYKELGGRGLISTIISDEVDPKNRGSWCRK